MHAGQVRGFKVGLVTNDQGEGLMDTDSASNSGAQGVEEITGGCFCCRLDDLGGKRQARDFHRDVGYVFRKQLEEAEWLVVNKIDLMSAEDLADLDERLAKEYPDKRIFMVSARNSEGLEPWFEALLDSNAQRQALMDVDYERSAVGEAMLRWVNSEAVCHAKETDHDWGKWLETLGRKIGNELDASGAETGHFKMSIEADGARWRFHKVMSGEEPVVIEEGGSPSEEVRFLVNLRAEGTAEILEAMVDRALAAQSEVRVEFKDRAAFQPGEPRPTLRVTELVG